MCKREILACVAICALATALGCASDSGPTTMATVGGIPCQPGSLGCPASGALGGQGAAGSTAARGGLVGMPGVLPTQPGMGGAAAPPVQAAATGVPCDVAQVVSSRCTGCHQSPTKFSAPMPLMTLADFQAAAKSNPARKVFQVIPERISATDPSKRMPPTSMSALTAAENQTLTKWVSAGAIASPIASSCPISAGDLVNNQGGAAGTSVKPDAGTSPTGAHMGGASITPIEYNDPDMKCYKFLAHAAGSKTAPYVAGSGEDYVAFSYAAPWQGVQYQRAIKLAIDPNSQVIHHWLLFKQSGPVIDGDVMPGELGTHTDGILLHGWAPGASPLYLDPDVGVQLEGSVGYLMEVHYNNPTGAPGNDASGAEVCVTPKKPAHIAELAWVGTDSIAGTSATGVCAPNGPFPIHIIAAQPHMHMMGTHMKVTINHVSGGAEVIHDQDFSFGNQRYYVLDATMMQGDTMTTECSYNGLAMFGKSTSQEMCYFFSLHWPAGALRSAGIGTVIHGADSCL